MRNEALGLAFFFGAVFAVSAGGYLVSLLLK